MREEIYKTVAMPSTFLWAPQLCAIANMAFQMTAMFVCFALFEINFLWFMVSIVCVHVFLASYGAREPHLDKMLQSQGKVPHRSQNMYPGKGVKLAP